LVVNSSGDRDLRTVAERANSRVTDVLPLRMIRAMPCVLVASRLSFPTSDK
jgi:hypothetical protein